MRGKRPDCSGASEAVWIPILNPRQHPEKSKLKLYLSTQPDNPQRVEEGACLPPAMWRDAPASRRRRLFNPQTVVKNAPTPPRRFLDTIVVGVVFVLPSYHHSACACPVTLSAHTLHAK